MTPLALIDVSWLAHRARTSLNGLSHDDMPTGVIFGFLDQLRNVAFDPKISSNNIHLFFDSKHSYRKDQFPGYKAKRQQNRTPEELEQIRVMKEQVDVLWEELPACGFKCYRQFGLESDDLIAMAVKTSCARKIVVTSDGDLYQLIDFATHWYDPKRQRYMDPPAFLGEYGIDPDHWGMVKAIAGCDTDSVPGIPGIGEKRALDYLNTLLPGRWKSIIESHDSTMIIKRNKPLVILPHAKTQPVKLADPVYNPEAFWKLCERFGLQSFLDSDRPKWDTFFAGTIGENRQPVITRRLNHGK